MDVAPSVAVEPPNSPTAWQVFSNRVIAGLFLVLPFLITCWVFRWLYLFVEANVIGPLTEFVVWKYKAAYPDSATSYWFEKIIAPLLGVGLLVAVLYAISFFAFTRVRQSMSWLLVHCPVFSWVYNPVRNVFKNLESTQEKGAHKRPQRMVLVSFPHGGMKVPAIVTGSCRDVSTQKSILCCYVPTTPVPTSGYFLLVPEDEATELNWDTEQTLQAIISGGLTTPPEVSYFRRQALAASATGP